jgi:hypothetical protein
MRGNSASERLGRSHGRSAARPLARAAKAYGAMNGMTAEAFMERIGMSLDQVASAILPALGGGVPTEINAIAVSPADIELLT